MRTASVAVIAAAVAVAVATLAGCTESSEVNEAKPTAPVIAPAKPGEPARTLDPDEAATAAPTPTPNAADVRFMQDMIVHHRQALDMSLLAPTRADSPELKRLAARIKDSQGPEINSMSGWLRREGQRVPEHHAGHQDMPGMATPEQLDELRAAKGERFDRLFVELMTAHHKGAITMVRGVLSDGSHYQVREIAGEIGVTQSAEILRMQRLLR